MEQTEQLIEGAPATADEASPLQTLVAETERRQKARTAAAIIEYRQIITRAAQPAAGDGERVLQLLAMLGRTDDQLRADVQAWEQRVKLQEQQRADENVASEQQRVMLEAHAAADAYRIESRDKLEALRRAASEASGTWAITCRRRERDEKTIGELEARFAHLFAAD